MGEIITTYYNRTIGSPCPDADVNAFALRAGITDETEILAYCVFVDFCKSTDDRGVSIWDRLRAIYPISPTSLEAARYNLKSSSFTLDYMGAAPTHATTGITGVSGIGGFYAKTGLVPIAQGMSAIDWFSYCRSRSSFAESGSNYGALAKSTGSRMNSRTLGGQAQFAFGLNIAPQNFANADGSGSYSYGRTFVFGNGVEIHYKNGVLLGAGVDNNNPIANLEQYLWAVNLFGSSDTSHTGREQTFFAFGQFLTQANHTLFDAAEQILQDTIIIGGR